MPDPSTYASIINSLLPEPNASLANGMLLGIPIEKSYAFYGEIKRSGLLHLVVLSGTNITILGAITGSFLQFLPKRLAIIANLCLIAMFVLFVGTQAPILRAAIMAGCTNLAIFFERKSLSLYSLLISLIVMLALVPEMIATLSFQLSFAASLGIILFGITNSQASALWKELKPSLAASAFTAPLIFMTFGEISFIAPLSNILVAWAVGPIMVVCFITILSALVHPALALLPAWILQALTTYVVLIIEICSSVPFSFMKF